jgi:D-glycero-D-manno-heptose 1,7-bisphosphate phosphatase
VSNQSGVNRGLIQPENLPKIHDRLNSYLRPMGGLIDEFVCCIHHPDENCTCRKPMPGLIQKSMSEFQLDPAHCYMVGDKLTDLSASRNAGLKAAVLVRTGEGRVTEAQLSASESADFTADSILEAANWILAQETSKH